LGAMERGARRVVTSAASNPSQIRLWLAVALDFVEPSGRDGTFFPAVRMQGVKGGMLL
jgi:hypothetical protein